MSLEDLWNKALRTTEIVRLPIKRLVTFGVSECNYVFLAPSEVNKGDTTVRKGRIDIDRPSLVLPQAGPLFEGFSGSSGSEINDEMLQKFFYLRGIHFPQLKYTNEPYKLDLFEGSLMQAEKKFNEEVRYKEQVNTGIVIGEDASWQFSVILMACHLIDTHIDSDLKAILDRIRKKN